VKSIAHAYLDLAQRVAARVPPPSVRELHLPVAAAPDSKDAEFCVLELEDGSFGLSYVWLADTLDAIKRHDWVHRVRGRELLELVGGYGCADPVERTLGMAAINALSQWLFTHVGWEPDDAGDSLGQLAPSPGEHIGMVGLFPPLVPRVVEAGAWLTVVELRAELAGEHDDYRVTLDPRALADCVKVVGTSTMLLNDTLDRVLAICRWARYLAVIGPTAGCLPDPLFDRGVDAVGGARVTDARGFLGAFQDGAAWGRFTRKYVISRDAYPGVEWLLTRARL
jgi:uncharacterized protein (DUF4213/DUF364 family)